MMYQFRLGFEGAAVSSPAVSLVAPSAGCWGGTFSAPSFLNCSSAIVLTRTSDRAPFVLPVRKVAQQGVDAGADHLVDQGEVRAEQEHSDDHDAGGRLYFLATRGRDLFHFRPDVAVKAFRPLGPRLHLLADIAHAFCVRRCCC